jgi:hypothetical protein
MSLVFVHSLVGWRSKMRLTQRAADGGYAARYFGILLALRSFRFDGESVLPPTAANAPRWAAAEKEILT